MRSTGSRASWTTRLLAAAFALCAAQCAMRVPHPGAFAFAVTGDTPYSEREEAAFVTMIERMNAEELAFVVHVGDLKSGESRCDDALYAARREQFDRSTHPWIYTPGDNDWTDCRRKSAGARDPLERLAKLREVFFAEPASRGAERMPLDSQRGCRKAAGARCACGPYVENVMWERGGVVFATVNLQGSDNNRGFDAPSDAEADCRDAANLEWLDLAAKRLSSARALAIFAQADPWVESPTRAYAPYLRKIAEIARASSKPVLFVHGDTHQYRVDQPFVDAIGLPIPNATRLETFGSPVVGWIHVAVDTQRPDVFTLDPHPVAILP